MKHAFVNLFGTRTLLAGVIETIVTAGTTALVTVFLVIMVAYPTVGFAQPGFDRSGVDLCTD